MSDRVLLSILCAAKQAQDEQAEDAFCEVMAGVLQAAILAIPAEHERVEGLYAAYVYFQHRGDMAAALRTMTDRLREIHGSEYTDALALAAADVGARALAAIQARVRQSCDA